MIVRSSMVISEAEELRTAQPSPGDAPRILRIEPQDNSRLAFLVEPAGLAVEQYKRLRGRLNAVQPRGGVLLMTSPGPGDGKTLTSINLAWSLAQGGFRTCLVDLDFRAPGLARTLGLTLEAGTEEALTGRQNPAKSMLQIGDRPFHMLGIRERVEQPSALFAPAVLGPLLTSLRAMYRWVILDMAPAIPISDVSDVLPQVDAALLVVRAGKTSKDLLPPLFELLGSKLRGVVLNDTPVLGSAYYGHYGQPRSESPDRA
jgi:Mrp family chromosome partitioning ATPase